MSQRRSRYYACIVYEESAPADWIEVLERQHIPAIISPLHDLDIKDDETGELKKPHYHVLVLWESQKSRDQAKELFELIGGVGAEMVGAIRSYARYLCHMDDRTKPQYDIAEIKELSGANYRALIKEQEDKYAVISEIIDFAISHQIVSYAELMEYARANNQRMFMALCDYPWPIIHYLKSRSWEIDRNTKKSKQKGGVKSEEAGANLGKE